MTLPTTEPLQFTAGDTVSWKKSFADYPASAGWLLSYAFVNATGLITVDGTAVVADGDDFVVTITAATSKDYTAGEYHWQAYVAKSGVRNQVGKGTTVIEPDFASADTTGYDPRSIVKKMLDALEATLLKKASKDQLSLTVPNGRKIERLNPSELLAWRDKLKAEYAQELKAANSNQGSGNRILYRFPR